MPYKTDKLKLDSPFLKRTAKLLPCQKEMIIYWSKVMGYSQRQLAKMFNVSRRTITFIIDPEQLKQNKERRLERGGSKQYYNKEKHNLEMKKHRNYKYQTLKNISPCN